MKCTYCHQPIDFDSVGRLTDGVDTVCGSSPVLYHELRKLIPYRWLITPLFYTKEGIRRYPARRFRTKIMAMAFVHRIEQQGLTPDIRQLR